MPFDPEKSFVTLGAHLGHPAGTTRSFGEAEFRQIARWIVQEVGGLAADGEDGNTAIETRLASAVSALCARFPLHQGL